MTELSRRHTPSPGVDISRVGHVRRDDLDTTLLAGGDLQPAKQTTVTCQVEDVTDSDGTMILSVIQNGATVKKGTSSAGWIPRRIEELARSKKSSSTRRGPCA